MEDFANFNPKKDGDAWEKEAEETLKKYRGRSENDIIRAIYEQAAEGKRKGTLTNEQIDAFYARFSPMLDAARKKRLKGLVEELKKL